MIDTHELTDTDRFIAQATYGLWDAAYSLRRVEASDLKQHEINSLASDIGDVIDELKRLQLAMIADALTDMQAELSAR